MSTKAIRKAIVAQLAANIDGTGDYTYNMSRTGPAQWVSGKFDKPPHNRLPFGCVYTAAIEEKPGRRADKLDQDATFVATAWAQGSPRDEESRQDAAEDLLDDIRRALRADITLGGLVLYLTVSATTMPLEMQEDHADYGVCIVVINVVYREAR